MAVSSNNDMLSLGFYDSVDPALRLCDFFPRDQNVIYAGNVNMDNSAGDQTAQDVNTQYVELRSLCPPSSSTSTCTVTNIVGGKKMQEESRKRRRSERLKVQSTIPTFPNTTISAQVSQINDEIVQLENSQCVASLSDAVMIEGEGEVGEGSGVVVDSDEEEEELDREGGEKAKKYWKDTGYDELSKVYRSFTQYERTLNIFASQFAHTAYLCHPFWLGRSHVNESKQSAMEYLTNEVMATCVTHGKALRNMRGILENLPFHPGTISNGKKIISHHPTEQFSCKRVVNAVKKKGEMVSMPDLVEYLEKKQKLIDAKQVCENTQVVTNPIIQELNAVKEYEKPPALSFATYREEYFKLIRRYFTPHHQLDFDKTKQMIKTKLGMETNRKFVGWFSKQFKLYSNIYSNSKTNPITSEEMLDVALKEHMTSFEVSFKRFLSELGKESSIYANNV